MNKAIFLDRDGVINIDYGHVHIIENFIFIDGIFELCKYFENEGYIIIVVTNQAGIGKGLYSFDDFVRLNNWMIYKFKENGVEIKKTYFCPHKPEENCYCRKPNPGMLLSAINEFDIDVNDSLLIGDKKSDIQAALNAGIRNTYLFTGTEHFSTIYALSTFN